MRQPGVKVKADPAEMSGLEDRMYSTSEVAAIFEANVQTVRKWIRDGDLEAVKGTTKQGHQVSRAAMRAFAIKRYMK
jgi:transposase-like protein